MIRAYDEYGNIIYLVEWEKRRSIAAENVWELGNLRF